MDTKGGEHDFRGGKTRGGVQAKPWGKACNAGTSTSGTSAPCRRRCPSLFDVACLESGDLTAPRRAVVLAHARRCLRCALSLAELSQARREILGTAPATRAAQAERAAQHIAQALRMRFH